MTQIEEIFVQLDKINEQLQIVLKNQRFTPLKEIMLFDWLDEWCKTYKKPNLSDNGLYQIQICINKHIKKNIDNMLLTALTPIVIQSSLNLIKSSRMQEYTFDVWNSCLRTAYRNKLIEYNPIDSLQKHYHKRKLGKPLSDRQLEFFLTCIKGHQYENLFKFYLLTGCRKSETLSLKWCDIDFENKQIQIHGTKTEKSERVIPMFEDTEILLKSLSKKGEFLFDTSPNAVEKSFQRLKKKYNLDFKIHDLRHTFATKCLEYGISMKLVQKWLGHSKFDTTANIYTHIRNEYELQEIKKFTLKIT